MFKHSFEFGAKPITITCANLIDAKILDLIYEFTQFVKYDFNVDIHLSSGYRFNATEKDSPVLLTKEFCEYLKLNYINAISLSNGFMPFYYVDKELLSHELEGEIVINKEIVVKTSNLMIDAKLLMQAYIVDAIFSLLLKNNSSKFLVASSNFFKADAKKTWDITFELEENLNYKTQLRGETIGFHFFHDYMVAKKRPTGFMNMDHTINPKYVIIRTESAIENKIKSYDFTKFGLESEFKTYARERKLDIVVFDKDDKDYYFSKDKTM